MRFFIVTIALMTLATAAQSADEAELRSELEQVDTQITALQLAARSSPEIAVLRQAIESAAAQLEQTVRSLPGMQELDASIASLKDELRRLQRARTAILRAHDAEIRQKELQVENAEDAYARARHGGTEMQALRARRNDLLRQLDLIELVAELRDAGVEE